MKDIKERAKEFTFGKSLQSCYRYDERSVYEGYIGGDADRHKIDKEAIYNLMNSIRVKDYIETSEDGEIDFNDKFYDLIGDKL